MEIAGTSLEQLESVVRRDAFFDLLRGNPETISHIAEDRGLRLDRAQAALDQLVTGGAATVEDVMEGGLTTTRADDDLERLTSRMRDRSVASIVITDPDGRLIGVLYRQDAEAALGSATP